MSYSTNLRDLLIDPEISNKEKILLLLMDGNCVPKAVSEIKEIAEKYGFRNKVFLSNISSYLNRLAPKVVRTENGWEITSKGILHLQNKGLVTTKIIRDQQLTLREYINKIEHEDVRSFLEEAITAFECKLYRSSVVLSWVGALSLMQEFVIMNHIDDFNNALIVRNPSQKIIKKKEEFSKIHEYDFLQICFGASIIGKSTKQQLEQCLKLRNGCGHPNKLTIGENMVAAHLEFLINNIFAVFI
ncbi:MAG: hypothetical protein SVV67_05495 [Bacillota bacterium]|nr:hypothetical protein [Bacillota bacterium]